MWYVLEASISQIVYYSCQKFDLAYLVGPVNLKI
jgi:hypothetical protein